MRWPRARIFPATRRRAVFACGELTGLQSGYGLPATRRCANPLIVDSLCTWNELDQQEQFPLLFYGVEGQETIEGSVLSLYVPTRKGAGRRTAHGLWPAPLRHVCPLQRVSKTCAHLLMCNQTVPS